MKLPEPVRIPTEGHKLGERQLSMFLWLACAAVVTHDLIYLIVGAASPVLDAHSFRQSQTAITAYWLQDDGFKLAYETPVLGAPWSIPFEFPLYQSIVAVLARLGVPIDVGGRVVSFAFLLACAFPLALVRRLLRLPTYALPLILTLVFMSPLYAFWGRTVMIETCAVFLALAWLALLMKLMADAAPSVSGSVGCAVLGCLAITQKSTTFAMFGLIGGALLASRLVTTFRSDRRRTPFLLGLGAATWALPLVVGVGWIVFTDHIKRLNPLADFLSSKNLAAWNYGTGAQRYSPELIGAIRRSLDDTLGLFDILGVGVILIGLLVPGRRIAVLVCFAAFLLPFEMFTNLHIVHSYYQASNALFVIAALGLATVSIIDLAGPAVGLAIFALVLAGQVFSFTIGFGRAIRADLTGRDIYQIALRAKQIVPPDQVILLDVGDWTSLVNYYSDRKGIALLPVWPMPLLGQVLGDPERFAGGKRVGAIVHCPADETRHADAFALLRAYRSDRRVLATAGRCEILSPVKTGGVSK